MQQPPGARHEDSETESEADVGEVCQAERVALLDNGHVTPLSTKPCKDVRKGEAIAVLVSDLPYSSREELEQRGDRYHFHACNHHRAMYENHASKKTCVIEGCDNESKVTKGGLRLCKLHATKEERVKKDPKPSQEGGPSTDSQTQPVKVRMDEEPFGTSRTEARNYEPRN